MAAFGEDHMPFDAMDFDMHQMTAEQQDSDASDHGSESDHMGLEVDEGVSLDVSHSVSSGNIIDTSQTAKIKAIYHQRPGSETDVSSHIWTMPVEPDRYEPHLWKQSEDHPIAKAYQKHCGLIKAHWGYQAGECLPEELRIQTPYSFALLSKLRRLAGRTQGQYPLAKYLLLTAWSETNSRSAQVVRETVLGPSGRGFGTFNFANFAEEKIQENPAGLMLDDVVRAIKYAKQKQADGRKTKTEQPSQMTRKERKRARERAQVEKSQATVGGRVAKRERRERAAKTQAYEKIKLATDSNGFQTLPPIHRDLAPKLPPIRRDPAPKQLISVPPNSPMFEHDAALHDKLESGGGIHPQRAAMIAKSPVSASPRALGKDHRPAAQHEQRKREEGGSERSGPNLLLLGPREVASRHNEQGTGGEVVLATSNKPLSKEQRQEDILSHKLAKIDIEAGNRLVMWQVHQLEAGDASRKQPGKMPMPSEKVWQNAPPPLYASSNPTTAMKMESSHIDQLPLLDRVEFNLPLRSNVAKFEGVEEL